MTATNNSNVNFNSSTSSQKQNPTYSRSNSRRPTCISATLSGTAPPQSQLPSSSPPQTRNDSLISSSHNPSHYNSFYQHHQHVVSPSQHPPMDSSQPQYPYQHTGSLLGSFIPHGPRTTVDMSACHNVQEVNSQVKVPDPSHL